MCSKFDNSQTALVCAGLATRYIFPSIDIAVRVANLFRTADLFHHLPAYGSSLSTRRLGKRLIIRKYRPMERQTLADE